MNNKRKKEKSRMPKDLDINRINNELSLVSSQIEQKLNKLKNLSGLIDIPFEFPIITKEEILNPQQEPPKMDFL